MNLKKYYLPIALVGLALTFSAMLSNADPLDVGAASVVSLGRNGTSTYLLYPTDSLTAFNFIASSTTSNNTFPNLLFTNATGTNATTTSLAVANLSAGLVKALAGGPLVNAVAGTDYENIITAGDGLTRTVNDFDCDTASGSVFGCLSSTDWTTFNGKESPLTFSYPLSRAVNAISLAFGTTTSNTWAGTQTFGNTIATNSTTTNATSTNLYVSGTATAVDGSYTGTISPIKNLSLYSATTTAWTGTTSGAYILTTVAPFAGTIRTAQCTTDAGTLNVDIYHTSTHLALFNASTTVGTITFSSNNTFTNGEKIYLSAGTPAGSPTSLSCTLGITKP